MTLVIIPARMASTRLPGKPLEWIGNKRLIERCVDQARKAGFQPYVATDSFEISDIFDETGVSVVMTEGCASGTDRVAAAAEIIDPEGKHEFVINYQGDQIIDPDHLKMFVKFAERQSKPSTATCVMEQVVVGSSFKRESVHLHIGLYGFPRQWLRKFAETKPTTLEFTSNLEQNRLNFFDWERINLPYMPFEINTFDDLDRVRMLCQS